MKTTLRSYLDTVRPSQSLRIVTAHNKKTAYEGMAINLQMGISNSFKDRFVTEVKEDEKTRDMIVTVSF